MNYKTKSPNSQDVVHTWTQTITQSKFTDNYCLTAGKGNDMDR